MKKSAFLILTLYTSLRVFSQENYNTSVYKGNQYFEEKKFEEASTHYLKAVKENNKDFKALYNLANSFYKQGLYTDAISQYDKALKQSKTKDEKISSLYNAGNAHYQNQNIDEAIKHYKKALKLSPNNETILKNLKIAEKKKQKEREKNKQPEQENKKNLEGNQKQEEEKNNTGENPENAPKSPENKEKNTQEEKLLNKIEKKEKHAAKRILNNRGYNYPKSNKKDW